MVEAREDEVETLVDRSRRTLRHRLDHAATDLEHTRARVVALSPAATLERGYAVLQKESGQAVRNPDEVDAGEKLTARVAAGRIAVVVEGR
jgi:exodeoxyribonuclease VII large subunit